MQGNSEGSVFMGIFSSSLGKVAECGLGLPRKQAGPLAFTSCLHAPPSLSGCPGQGFGGEGSASPCCVLV